MVAAQSGWGYTGFGKPVMLKKTSAFTMTIAALLAISTLPAQASVIDWTLQNVAFSDGGSASGTFSTDSTTGNVLSFNITTTSGTKLGGTVYDNTVAQVLNDFWAPNSFDITDEGAHVYLELAFVDPLTAPGTDFLALQRASYECDNCSPARIVVAGEAVSEAPTQVPEPATSTLFVMGLFGLGAIFQRRA
jgi:hypothetical protein